MAVRLVKKLPGVESVAAGSRASLKLPIGRTYYQVALKYAGVTLAQMKNFEILVNGIVFQKYRSATEIEKFALYQGMPVLAALLILDFERMGLLSEANRLITALGTGVTNPNGVTPTIVEIAFDIDAGAAAPVISAEAVTGPPSPLGLLRKIRNFSVPVGVTGEIEISDLPRSNLIEMVAFDTSTVTLTDVSVELDGVKIIDGPWTLHEHLADRGLRAPQAGLKVLDFCYAGFGSDVLNAGGSQDFRIKVEATATGSLPVTVYYLGPLEG